MTTGPDEEISVCLQRLERGDRTAIHELLPHIYGDLRNLARGLFGGQGNYTLQPTALVHEAYMRLAGTKNPGWKSKRHFYDVAAMAMRQLLADHARRRNAAKRGGGQGRVVLEDAELQAAAGDADLAALNDALEQLEELDPRQARVVELRYFAGLTIAETAEVLEVSKRTVDIDWKMARVFLSDALGEDAPEKGRELT